MINIRYMTLVAIAALVMTLSGCCGMTALPDVPGLPGTGDAGDAKTISVGKGMIFQLVPKEDGSGYQAGNYYVTTVDGPDVVDLQEMVWNGSWNVTPVTSLGAVVDPASYTESEKDYLARGWYGDSAIYASITVKAADNFTMTDERIWNVFHQSPVGFTRAIVYE